MPPYRHTQIGYVVIVTLVGALILTGIVLPGDVQPFGRVATLGLVAVAGLMFSTLTVEVRDRVLRIWFGPGFPRRHWSVQEITSARVVRNPWYVGWGIHWGGCWVYNVSGLEAVEITLRGGRRFRIGTDEPEALVSALSRPSGA